MSKLIRGTFLGKDPLSIQYIRSVNQKNTNLSDNDCINIITEFNKHSLKQDVFCKILKNLSGDLKFFLAGTNQVFSQNKEKNLEIIRSHIRDTEAQIEHRFNAKGKKTKHYKTFLKISQIKSDDIIGLLDCFYESGNGFFDLPEKNKENLIKILFSVTNFSRLFKSNVDLSDPDVRSSLLASILGEDSEKISKEFVLEFLGDDLETVMEDYLSVFKGKKYPSNYNINNDINHVYVTNKAGPNGPNALLHVGIDALALKDNSALHSAIEE
jgi:hypothetical protein